MKGSASARELAIFESADATGDHHIAPQVFGASGSSSASEPPANATSGSLTRPRGPLGDKDLPPSPVEDHSPGGSTRLQWSPILMHTTFTVRMLVKLTGLGLMIVVFFISAINWPPWVIEEAGVRMQVMSTLFIVGLFIVAVEDFVHINKSALMLVLAATMWTFLAVGFHPTESEDGAKGLHRELERGLLKVGSVVLFLLPAMGIVESIDHFDGFAIVTHLIHQSIQSQPERLMFIICILTFFLSSVIDNLTSTIVALKILRHLVQEDEDRRRCLGGLAVVAANAGGAWSPVGDVTTTMLWIERKITAPQTVSWLFLPSFVAAMLPMAGVWWQTRGAAQEAMLHARSPLGLKNPAALGQDADLPMPPRPASPRRLENAPLRALASHMDYPDEALELKAVTRLNVAVLVLGILCILMVPALKIWTGVPPYLGMLMALGTFWIVTDCMVSPDDSNADTCEDLVEGTPTSPCGDHAEGVGGVVEALHKVDLTGLLFFAGVLLAVGALDSAGVLRRYATFLVQLCGHNTFTLCSLLGLSSALVDNVPLVEAAIDMFRETSVDRPLWQLVALAAGTGGSILSIGSIAGVTLMSMEGVGFLWYLRRIGIWALLGFAGGMVTYQIERSLFS